MKVLFVASGNKKGAGQVNSFVQSQYDSLKAEGLEMVLFPIVGKGWRGYAKAVFALRKLVKLEKPDIIHAHYSTCGFVASLATMCMRDKPKIVVSILGSFPTLNAKWRRVKWAIKRLWDGALVKSKRTKRQLGLDVPVIPNGVNLEIFEAKSKVDSRKSIGFEDGKHYVVWCSNPNRIEKNWKLAEDAVHLLNDEMSRESNDASAMSNEPLRSMSRDKSLNEIQLVPVYDKTPDVVATYMNAADCLLLTSWSEGSPNVIKEAMACGCPIVTTDVGDVNERLEGLEGCYVAKTEHPVVNEETQRLYGKENAEALAECLAKVLGNPMRTKGNERIIQDGLTIELTAKKIIKLYDECI